MPASHVNEFSLFEEVRPRRVVAAAAAAIGAGSMLPASAAPPPTTVTVTGAYRNQSDANSKAFATCQQQGYNADRVDNTVTNADGTVTVTVYCYTV
jgi:hypothetical protein